MMNESNDIDKNPLTERYLQKAQVRIIPEVWPWRMSWVFTGGCMVKSLWESRHSMCRPVHRACAARWPGEGTGCDTIGALAEVWRTGFLPFNPYNPLPISVCMSLPCNPYNTHIHCPSRKATSLLLSKWFLSNLSPPWCLSPTPTHLLSQQEDLHSTQNTASTISLICSSFLSLPDCPSSFSTRIEFYLHWEYFHDYPPALPMMLSYMPFLMFLTHYGTHHTAL